MFISTSSTLLVQIAGGQLGASAIGFVYSIRYVLISILTPIAQVIAAVSQRYNGWMFFAFEIVSLALVSLVINFELGW